MAEVKVIVIVDGAPVDVGISEIDSDYVNFELQMRLETKKINDFLEIVEKLNGPIDI